MDPSASFGGSGVVVLTMMLHKYKDRDDRYIFLFGTVVGGAYEYICSVFTEIAFGTVFWDYSKLPSTWAEESTFCTVFLGTRRCCLD